MIDGQILISNWDASDKLKFLLQEHSDHAKGEDIDQIRDLELGNGELKVISTF